MESFSQVFYAVKEIFRKNLSATAFHLWVEPVRFVEEKDNEVILSVQNKFQYDIIEPKYIPMFADYFHEILGYPVNLKLIIIEEKPTKQKDPIALKREEREKKREEEKAKEGKEKKELPYENEYTFENFIVGPSNTFAYAACRAIVKEQFDAYNPLFIYGPSGLGKTHLLLAIYSSLKKKFPYYDIMYVNGETFTNELIASIEDKTTAQFRKKYRNIDVLLMDDVQFLAGKTQTQEEFFHTFNELHQSGHQIVLTSDRPPKDIKTLEDRLRTRFEWGLIADIYPPNIETRIAIIKKKAEELELNIPEPIIEYLAKNLKDNIRQLEGAVKKFKVYEMLSGSRPTLALAQSIINEVLNNDQPVPVTVEKIIEEIGNTFGVTAEDIRSSKRSSQVSTARQFAIYVVREITQMSYTDIGKEFNGRDHATIVYALQKVEKIMKQNPHQREVIEDIIKNIRN